MPTLRIEHPVTDYAEWKAVFESDLAHRKQSGVRGYRIHRQLDDPRYVLVDLDFDTVGEAEAFLATLRDLWARQEVEVTSSQQARIVETVGSG